MTSTPARERAKATVWTPWATRSDNRSADSATALRRRAVAPSWPAAVGSSAAAVPPAASTPPPSTPPAPRIDPPRIDAARIDALRIDALRTDAGRGDLGTPPVPRLAGLPQPEGE